MPHPSLAQTSHRPWSLPAEPWRWRQSWLDLAFIHYRVDAASLQKRLPASVSLQEFAGSAWIGVVPFRMAGVMRRPLPNLLPGFPELNLRTYVEVDGRAGVWFFSLDTNFLPLVAGGRFVYRLPYYPATMKQAWAGGWCVFQSQRWQGNARFRGRYRPLGDAFTAVPGTLEHWLTERYCLFAQLRKGGIARVDVHHVPWPLQRAEVELDACTLPQAAGLTAVDDPPVCHFSTGVHVVSYGLAKGSHRILP